MRVDQLWRFPVKSLLGESVDEVELSDRGVVGDRGYALVDTGDGKVASAKNPRKWPRLLELAAFWVEPPSAGRDLPPVAVHFPDGTSLRSDDPAVDRALSSFLGRGVHLTSTPPATVTLEETWPPDIEGVAPEGFIEATRIDTGDPEEVVSDITMAMAAPPGTFFDLATLHLLTSSTLAALAAAHPGGTFDVRRYRPNVFVSSPDHETGYVENAWVGREVALGDGGAAMAVQVPTMRCIMTTLAQGELPRDPALLRTIAAENRLEFYGGTWACAGVYGGVVGTGTVRVGDAVTVR